jgi:hypothetical protein
MTKPRIRSFTQAKKESTQEDRLAAIRKAQEHCKEVSKRVADRNRPLKERKERQMASIDYFAEPYSTRRVGLWHDVVHEDDTVIYSSLIEETANRITAALNGAYNLGRSFELIRQEILKED